MHIGINGWYCNKPHTGIGQYTINLIRGLASMGRGEKLVVFIHEPTPQDGDDLPQGRDVEYVSLEKQAPSNDIVDRLVFEHKLRSRAVVRRLDLVHTPFLYGPDSKSRTLKHVVTLHDVIQKVYPVYRGGHVRRFFLSRYELRLRNVDAIVTDSQFSRQDIEKYLHVEHRKIKVIDLAADPSFNSNVDRSELDYVKRKYSLPEKFILYVGGFDLRKNVGVMLRAYASLRNQDLIEHKLMLAGRFQPSAKQLRLSLVSDVPRLIRELRMGNDVKLMGFVPQSDLPALYRLASLFVYPSLYEGFGLPVLEAMTCGTPTLASERSSIPEILNREDLLFNPEDVELIQQKMLRVLSDPRLMEEISQWVKKRAKDFSWMRTAQETMDLYAALVGSEPKLDTN